MRHRFLSLGLAVLISAAAFAPALLALELGSGTDDGAAPGVGAHASALPAYTGGYGYDPATSTMTDLNGFKYSYLPDGIIKLVLPWGYTTYFSFGLTASYLGVPQKVTALSYTWTWTASATARYNDTGVLLGYDYTFTATNSATLAWTIRLDFTCTLGSHMKVTHTVRNGYPNALTGAEFWFLFDLTHTPSPAVTTRSGTYYPPLYADLPASITWARLSNQFQFDWRDADWPNGHAYLGSGSIVGLTIDILGIGILLGDIPAGATRTVDPYFSGVTRTWAAAGNSYSGIAASWSPAGVPATGDNITFDATSVFSCIWNTTVTLGNFQMGVGYSGVVTQAASFSVTGYVLAAGTYTGSTSYTLTDSGDFSHTGGTLSATTLTLTMTGDSTTIVVVANSRINGLIINANVALTTANYLQVDNILTIASGKILTINSGQTLQWKTYYPASALSNSGTIAGAGTFLVLTAGSKPAVTVDFGVITAPTTLSSGNGQIADMTLTLGGTGKFGSTLAVGTSDTSYGHTLTLDLSASNYDLSATVITMGARGIINARGSSVSCSGAWDSSAGTFTAGTSTVYLTGTGSTVKTANSNGAFYDLVLGGTYTTTSSVNVTHSLQVNASKSITVGAGKTLTLTDAALTNMGTIIGTGSFVIGTSIDRTITPGVITTAPTTIKQLASASAPRKVTLGGDMSVGALLTVDSAHASYGMTFDLGAYDLTTTTGSDLVLSNDAYLVSGTGTVTVADDMTLGASWSATGTTVSVTDLLSLGGSASLTGCTVTAADMTSASDLTLTNGSIATTDDLALSGILTASGTDFAVNDDCALSGASTVTGGDFAVGGDLNVSADLTLSPATLTLSQDLRVSGTASVFVTVPFTVTDDLVIASTASLTTYTDFTVGGDWLLYDAAWTHGTQVVTLSGTCALNMTTSAFWNVTVSGTATLAEDALVGLRATVTGTVIGPGDFIEPEPEFASWPDANANILEVYNLTVTQSYWDALAYDGPGFLALYGDRLMGVPQESDAGIYNISLSLTWNDMTTYRNWTLVVPVPVISDMDLTVVGIIISLVMGFGCLVVGLIFKYPHFILFSGLIWLFSAVGVYAELNTAWAILSMGFGVLLLLDGGVKIAKV